MSSQGRSQQRKAIRLEQHPDSGQVASVGPEQPLQSWRPDFLLGSRCTATHLSSIVRCRVQSGSGARLVHAPERFKGSRGLPDRYM